MSDSSWFFGYGSLVNCKTHNYPNARPASLKGWRRAWVGTAMREFCFLSAYPIQPSAQSSIEGLIAQVPGNDWQALDQREHAYTRHPVGHLINPPTMAETIQIYSIQPKDHEENTRPKPILLSYLDVVLTGYDRVFGRESVTRFIETTDNWERPILNDRANPIYPRHQALSIADQAWIDSFLKAVPHT